MITQSSGPKNKYRRAKTLVDDFLARNSARAAPSHWRYLGHLMWCEARRNQAFQHALLRVASFHLARHALRHPLPTLNIED
jgi:hypothetical protein